MSTPRRKNKNDLNKWVDIDEYLKDIKPGEVRMLGDNIYAGVVFLEENPAPIKKPGNPKRKKKK